MGTAGFPFPLCTTQNGFPLMTSWTKEECLCTALSKLQRMDGTRQSFFQLASSKPSILFGSFRYAKAKAFQGCFRHYCCIDSSSFFFVCILMPWIGSKEVNTWNTKKKSHIIDLTNKIAKQTSWQSFANKILFKWTLVAESTLGMCQRTQDSDCGEPCAWDGE